jgi:Kef-type K+ transport system membrane component KefB
MAGVAPPFACSFAFGAILPTSLLPSVANHLIASLFLGTALAISSVKIVALVASSGAPTKALRSAGSSF